MGSVLEMIPDWFSLLETHPLRVLVQSARGLSGSPVRPCFRAWVVDQMALQAKRVVAQGPRLPHLPGGQTASGALPLKCNHPGSWQRQPALVIPILHDQAGGSLPEAFALHPDLAVLPFLAEQETNSSSPLVCVQLNECVWRPYK